MLASNLKQGSLVIFLLVNSICTFAGAPTRQQQLLSNNFNSSIPGTPVGNGGPSVGEPVSVGSLQAHIQQLNASNNAVIIERLVNAYSGGHVRWEFLNDTEVTDGSIIIAFEFTPTDLDNYGLLIRERGGSSQVFMDLIYDETGSYQVNDQTGSIPFANGGYSADQPQQIVMSFDLDAGTSDLNINGTDIFSGREHGVTGRGVGSLLTGYDSDTEFSPFFIDNIKVVGDVPLPLVLDVDLENKTLGQPIGTGGAAVNEPVSISADIMSEVYEDMFGNKVLFLQYLNEFNNAVSMRWEFLNNFEVAGGLVVIEADLQFESLDFYMFLIREKTTARQSFASLNFTSNGSISLSDGNGSAGSIGSYQTNQQHRLKLVFDLDAGMYSIFLDNEALIENRLYGDTEGRGIGSIITGFSSQATFNTAYTVDNLQVGSSFIADDIIHKNGFE